MSCDCPDCGSQAFKKNGFTRHGKQNHRCLDCGRQFSLEIQEVFLGGDLPAPVQNCALSFKEPSSYTDRDS